MPVRSILAVLAALIALPASAETNQAKLAILGFAPDGSAFAFEQFGWSSGSRYPYSDLSVISAASGRPFVGAPFQSLIVQDQATQESARLMSYTAAQRLLMSLHIGTPGVVLARASGDPRDPSAASLSFDLPSFGPVSIKLDGAVVKSTACEALGVKVRVLAIRLLDAKGEVLRNLHKEKNPPPDRFCPTGYGLAEVRMLPRPNGAPVLAMIVGINRPGGDGDDRRYTGFVVDLAAPGAAESGE
jgi:predicted secreted protein